MTKDAPDIVVYPPYTFLVAMILSWGANLVLPLGVLPPLGLNWSGVVGAALCMASGALGLSAVWAFWRADTPVSPHHTPRNFTRRGAYRITRNPMYLALLLLLAGTGFGLGNPYALIATPALFATLHYGVILREETYLSQKFGAEYEAYLKATKRWI